MTLSARIMTINTQINVIRILAVVSIMASFLFAAYCASVFSNTNPPIVPSSVFTARTKCTGIFTLISYPSGLLPGVISNFIHILSACSTTSNQSASLQLNKMPLAEISIPRVCIFLFFPFLSFKINSTS